MDLFPPRTYWVVPGRFLAGCFPGSSDPAKHREKLRRLVDLGIRTFVNLMEAGERNGAGQPFADYAEPVRRFAREHGVDGVCLRFPIPDGGIPSRTGMAEILDAIDTGMNRGAVYLHCRGGVGRTGTVVGCWLLRHGRATPETVLEEVRRLREMDRVCGHRRAPETPEQARFILDWLRA